MSEVAIPEEICQHCKWMEAAGISHTKNCRCGHHHNVHNFAGGCTIIVEKDAQRLDAQGNTVIYDRYCDCNGYDQRERVIHTVVVSETEAKVVKPKKPVYILELPDSLAVSTEKMDTHKMLVDAQARVDALKTRTISSTVEQSPD